MRGRFCRALLVLLVLGGGLLLIFGLLVRGEGLFGPKVGVLEIQGVIEDPWELLDWIERFSKDERVKAVILKVNSPGGSVGATQELYRALMRLRNKKKVVASLGDVAASGGYYVASAAHKVVSNPGTLTGSIGVAMYFTDFEGLMKKVGVRSHVVKSGPYKDIGSPFRRMTEEEKRLLEGVITDVHRQFLEDVSHARGIPLERLETVADGRVFSGRQALELGLVDQLGGFQEALELAKSLAGIKEEPELVFARKRRGLLRELLESFGLVGYGEVLTPRFGFFFLWQP